MQFAGYLKKAQGRGTFQPVKKHTNPVGHRPGTFPKRNKSPNAGSIPQPGNEIYAKKTLPAIIPSAIGPLALKKCLGKAHLGRRQGLKRRGKSSL
jgi:hypothetical protein